MRDRPQRRSTATAPVTRRVLVAEGDPQRRKALAEALEKSGYEVETTGSGAGLCPPRRPLEFGLVLIPADLPKSDAREICRCMKADPATSLAPVVILSRAEPAGGEKLAAFQSGADGWLCCPPGEEDEVPDQIRRWWSVHVTARQAQHSEKWWRSLVQSIPDFLLVIDKDGTILFINRTVPIIPGDAVLGTKVYDYVPEKFHAVMRETFEQVLSTGQPASYEIEGMAGYGAMAWYMSRVAVVEAEPGSLVVVARDITEHKRADQELLQLRQMLEKRVADRTSQLQASNDALLREIEFHMRLAEQLKEKEAFARTIMDASGSNLAVLDENGLIVAVNQAWERFARENSDGKLIKAGVGANYFDVCRDARGPQSEEAAAALAGLEQVLSGRLPVFDLEYPCHSPDKKRWFMMRAVPLTNARRGLVVSHFDITRLRRAELEMRQSEARFRSLSACSPVGIFMTDKAGRCTYTNARCQEICGFTLDEALGDGWKNFIHPDDRKCVIGAWTKAAAEGKSWTAELRFQHRDGTVRWSLAHSAPLVLNDSNGGPGMEGHVGTVEDITDRKLAEETLTQKGAQLVSAERLAGVGSWAWDVPSGRLAWSEELFRIYHEDPATFTPRYETFLERVHSDDREYVREQIETALQKGGPFDYEYRCLRPDGSTRFHHTIGEVILDRGGRPLKMIGTCRDITRQKKAERALRELPRRILDAEENERRRVARELHDSVSQLLFSIQFRLKSVQARLRAADRETRGDLAKTSELLKKTQEEVLRVSQNLRPSELDDLGLLPAIRNACQEFETRSGIEVVNEGLSLPARLAPETEMALYRVIQEALTNVEKHSGASKLFICLEHRTGFIVLRLKDNGKGFDLSKGRKGSGLANMRERAEMAGGRFDLQSKPGLGAQISVRIPLKDNFVNESGKKAQKKNPDPPCRRSSGRARGNPVLPQRRQAS